MVASFDLRPRMRRAWAALENPVMGRELRSRMRGARSYGITAGYVAVLAACVLMSYWMLASSYQGEALNQRAAHVGRNLWMVGCMAQSLLLVLVTPAFTCGSITLERERHLLEMLLLTRQSPVQVCLGKFGAGVGLGLTLVLASMPALSIALLLGGVSPAQIGACLCVLVTSVLAAGALGLAASAFSTRTIVATARAYGVVGAGFFGVPIFGIFLSQGRFDAVGSSDGGLLFLMAVTLVLTFPVAAGFALLLSGLRRRKASPPTRLWWIVSIGLSETLLLLVCLPGITGAIIQLLFTEGFFVPLLFHPMVAVFAVMNEPAGLPSLMPHSWWITSATHLLAACWLFMMAVLRLRSLRIA